MGAARESKRVKVLLKESEANGVPTFSRGVVALLRPISPQQLLARLRERLGRGWRNINVIFYRWGFTMFSFLHPLPRPSPASGRGSVVHNFLPPNLFMQQHRSLRSLFWSRYLCFSPLHRPPISPPHLEKTVANFSQRRIFRRFHQMLKGIFPS